MPAGNVEAYIQRAEQLASERGQLSSLWQEIADYQYPERSTFTTSYTEGTRRRDLIFDSEAEISRERFANLLHTHLTPNGSPWFYLAVPDETVMKRQPVRMWLEEVTRRIYHVLNHPSSRFHSRAAELYNDIAAFGTGVKFIGEAPGFGVYLKNHHLSECLVDVDDRGDIDSMYRTWTMNPRQAVQMFGEETPAVVRKALDEGKTGRSFTFMHAVLPRTDRVEGRPDRANMPFLSCYILRDTKEKIGQEGGYNDFPYVVPRWRVASGEMYGSGPGRSVLSDVKMLNTMTKTIIRAYQKVTDPPLAVPDDGFLRPLKTAPGSLNPYDSMRGSFRDQVFPMYTGQRPDLGEQKAEQIRNAIRRGYYLDVLESLPPPVTERGSVQHMSATEAAIRQRDSLRLLEPMVARLNTEFKTPMVLRAARIMARLGLLPPPPAELRGAPVEPVYVSPLDVALASTEVNSLLQTIESLRPLADILGPQVMEPFHPDRTAQFVARNLRAPAETLRSTEELAALREQQAQDQAQERQAALGVEGAKAAELSTRAMANVRRTA